MTKDNRDGTSVKTSVDVVEDGAGERDGEVEFIHGGDVGGDDGNDVATVDVEGGECGGELETSTVGLRPGVNGVVIDNGRNVAVNGGSSF